jgi:hypothetical protein
MHSRKRFEVAAFTLPFLLALSAPHLHADDGATGTVELVTVELVTVELVTVELVTVELVTDGLDEPSNLASPPDGRERIYVIDYHVAEIRVIADGGLLPEVFLDLSDRLLANPDIEDGVLSLAFSPRFPQTPYVYVTFIDVDGDLGLSGGDLRAAERCFQLLYQVAGRSGREQRPVKSESCWEFWWLRHALSGGCRGRRRPRSPDRALP